MTLRKTRLHLSYSYTVQYTVGYIGDFEPTADLRTRRTPDTYYNWGGGGVWSNHPPPSKARTASIKIKKL